MSGLAVARAHRRAAYKQLPVTETRKKLAAVTLMGPHIGKMRGSVSQARLVGATAAVPRYGAVSRTTSTNVAGWLRTVCRGSSGDFGVICQT